MRTVFVLKRFKESASILGRNRRSGLVMVLDQPGRRVGTANLSRQSGADLGVVAMRPEWSLPPSGARFVEPFGPGRTHCVQQDNDYAVKNCQTAIGLAGIVQ